MTFPNTITTADAVFNTVTARLATITTLNLGNVWISAAVTWLGNNHPGDRYVEVVPGVAIDLSSVNGVGKRKHTFTVAVFWRLYSDQHGQDTARLADASLGLLKFMDSIDSAIINRALGGLALVPVLPDRMEQAERDPQELTGGWVVVRRVYNVVYQYSFPSTTDIAGLTISSVTGGSGFVVATFSGTVTDSDFLTGRFEVLMGGQWVADDTGGIVVSGQPTKLEFDSAGWTTTTVGLRWRMRISPVGVAAYQTGTVV